METYKLYNGKIILQFDPAKHIYRIGDKIIYGVTNIVSILNRPALVNWATKLAIDKVREKKDLLATDLEAVLAEAKREHYEVSKRAAELGTRVHAVADRWFSEDKLGLFREMLAVKNDEERNALSAFLKFIQQNKVKRELGERKIYSKKYQYAGTADFIGQINGKKVVADYKTSSAIYPEYFAQTAAYAQALEEEGFSIQETAIIRIGKDGSLEVKTDKNWKKKLPVFLAMKKIYEWQMQLLEEEFTQDIKPSKVVKIEEKEKVLTH